MPGTLNVGGHNIITHSGTSGAGTVDADNIDTVNIGNNALVVDSSGNVGIGTSSPAGPLDVAGNDGVTVRRVSQTNGFIIRPTASGDGVRFTQEGTGDRMTINSSGEVLILKEDFGNSGVSNNAGIACTINQGTNIPGFTVSGDSSSYGDIGFGLYSNTVGSWQFYVSYDGEVNYKSLNSLSDIREKQNISDSTIGLNEVLNLKPKTFQWINSEDDKYYIGFVAQDVQEVIPSIVSERLINEEEETRFGISIDQLIPILTKAIQEQQTLIESQQSQIDALTAKTQEQDLTIASLISRIEALENA